VRACYIDARCVCVCLCLCLCVCLCLCLLSRAHVDAADQFNHINRWVAGEILHVGAAVVVSLCECACARYCVVRRVVACCVPLHLSQCDDDHMRLSTLKRMIEIAHLCRALHNLHAM
jgi:hypothetical protein